MRSADREKGNTDKEKREGDGEKGIMPNLKESKQKEEKEMTDLYGSLQKKK